MRDCLRRKCGFYATVMAFLMLLPLYSCVRPETPEEEMPKIQSSRDYITFAGNGGDRTIEITANGAWTVQVSEKWITISPESAAGNKTVTMKVDPNTTDQERTGTVDFILTAYPDVKATIDIKQSAKGEGGADEPEEPGEVIPRENFSVESSWGITGSIMSLNWGNSGATDIPMKEDVGGSGWLAAFDVVVAAEGEQFKFRQDNSWAVNLGTGAGQPSIDRRYYVADDGMDNNFALPVGTYDIYLHPQFMMMYVENAGDEFAHGDAQAESHEDENVRIYVLNNSTWTKPYMYAYVGSGEMQPYGQWPGTYSAGTKEFNGYTWTYWEASGFSGVGSINLILNNNGKDQYPAKDEKDPLWSNLTIHNNLFYVWDGNKLTQVDDPSKPGVEGKGITPDFVKFGTSSWTIIGIIEGSSWDMDLAMDTEGYWEVAKDVTVASGDMFKFRQNRSWGNNYGYGDNMGDNAREATPGAKLDMQPGGANISVAPGSYDIYLAAENKICYILPAGSAWTHEAEGKPEYSGSGDYDPNLAPANKLSGITYQVNVFSFKDSNGDGYGDLKGLTQSLDYFDKLGVTGLWLSPLQPAQSYHGYDVKDYFSLNKKYGTEEDFQELIQEAHKHNIRIYMDYVINHAGDDSEWFNDIKKKGPESDYWDYFSLSKNPEADVAAGKIAQTQYYESGKWFPVLIGGEGKYRFKIDLDWTNSSAPTMTVTETTASVTPTVTSGTNPERYLQWGTSTTRFQDNGTNKYTLVLDFQSSWGCLVRTNSGDEWPLGSKWGFNSMGDQIKLGVPHVLYNSTENNDIIKNIVMPGGDMYYYYTEFGTGMFVDFNYGPADNCQNSNAFKAIIQSAKKWLEMGVDGFRLDAVKHIYQNETGPENKTFWKKFYSACNEIYKGSVATMARQDLTGWADENIFMVGEVLSGDGDCTPFYEGLPALFEFQFWWDLRECLNGESIYNAGYGQNFPGSLKYRWDNHKGVRADAISTPKLANHDEDRTASTLGNYKPKVRLAACVLLTSAGRPYIYQGEELGYWGTKQFGDEYVRTPILWTPQKSSAASKGVSNKVDWTMLKPEISVERQEADDASLLNLYRHFAYARSVNPALADGWPEPDDATTGGYDGRIAGWYMHQNGGDKVVLVLHNLSSYTITVDRSAHGNDLSHILVSSGKVTVSGYNVTMPGYSSVVFALN